jgi:hypothetical protein
VYVTVAEETVELENGTAKVNRPRVYVEWDPESAVCINAAIDTYLAELLESFRWIDANNPAEYPNEFVVTPEVTVVTMYYLSLRFEEYYGLRAAAYPTSELSVMLMDMGCIPMTIDDVVVYDGSPVLLAMVEDRILAEFGDTFGARIDLEDLALFPEGIEVTIDEGHGLPHVVGRIVVSFSWEEIREIVNRERLWWLVGHIIGVE